VKNQQKSKTRHKTSEANCTEKMKNEKEDMKQLFKVQLL